MFKGFASVDRLINSIAVADAVSRIRFSRSDPQHVFIVGICRDGSDGNGILIIKMMTDCDASVFTFQQTSTSRSDVPQ